MLTMTKQHFILLALAASLSMSVHASLRTDYRDADRRADEAIAAQDYERAHRVMSLQLAAAEASLASAPVEAKEIKSSALSKLGKIEVLMRKTAEAEKSFLLAAALYDNEAPGQHALLQLEPLQSLEMLYFEIGDYEKVITTSQRELELVKKSGTHETEQIPGLAMQGKSNLMLNRIGPAQQELEQALAIFNRNNRVEKSGIADVFSSLADIYHRRGDEKLAETMRKGPDFSPKTIDTRTVKTLQASSATKPHSETSPEAYSDLIVVPGCRPKYPRESLIREQQGIVRISLEVDVDGTLIDSSISTSSGFAALDEETLNSMRHCKFRPAYKDGQPIRSTFQAEYRWTLPN